MRNFDIMWTGDEIVALEPEPVCENPYPEEETVRVPSGTIRCRRCGQMVSASEEGIRTHLREVHPAVAASCAAEYGESIAA